MTTRIFKKLNMNNTLCNPLMATSIGYTRLNNKIVPLGYGRDTSGDGCIVTTVADLSIWLNAVLNKDSILTESSWYQHNGSDMGYITFVFLSFEKQITVSICQNLEALQLNDDAGRVEFNIMQCIDQFL